MGQARQRGTFEERKAAAIARDAGKVKKKDEPYVSQGGFARGRIIPLTNILTSIMPPHSREPSDEPQHG